MKISSLFILMCFLMLSSCSEKVTTSADVPDQAEIFKTEIMNVEKAFEEMVKTEGMAAAFLHFAAEDAVLERNEKLIIGKDAIATYLKSMTMKNVSLEWTPEFIDVSAMGDMAYTYGTYNFSGTDMLVGEVTSTGTFHTVWKRQADGSWKYVYD